MKNSRHKYEPGDGQSHDQDEIATPPVIHLLGVDFHDVTLNDVLSAIDDRIRTRQPGYVVTPNVDHVCRLHRDDRFRQAYAESFLSLADGVPVIWASRLLGRPIREKISGSDLVYWLSEHCAKRGHSVFLFGAAEGVAETAAKALQSRYPGLCVVGTYSPPMGFEKDPEQTAKAVALIRAAQPDVCFVALGSPKQEFWLQDYARASGVPVSLGIGAGLDFAAGVTRRAPRLFQRTGLEWLWRLCLDPRRLAKRYLIDDSLFFLLVWREWRGRSSARTA